MCGAEGGAAGGCAAGRWHTPPFVSFWGQSPGLGVLPNWCLTPITHPSLPHFGMYPHPAAQKCRLGFLNSNSNTKSPGSGCLGVLPVSYTHLTLPTNREV